MGSIYIPASCPENPRAWVCCKKLLFHGSHRVMTQLKWLSKAKRLGNSGTMGELLRCGAESPKHKDKKTANLGNQKHLGARWRDLPVWYQTAECEEVRFLPGRYVSWTAGLPCSLGGDVRLALLCPAGRSSATPKPSKGRATMRMAEGAGSPRDGLNWWELQWEWQDSVPDFLWSRPTTGPSPAPSNDSLCCSLDLLGCFSCSKNSESSVGGG